MLKVFFWWNKFHSRLDVIWGKHVFCSFITSLRASGFTDISRSNCLQVFCRKSVFRNFAKFTWKNLCQDLFFNKAAGLRISTLLKKRLWHRYFHVDFAKSLRTNFFYRTPPVVGSASQELFSGELCMDTHCHFSDTHCREFVYKTLELFNF